MAVAGLSTNTVVIDKQIVIVVILMLGHSLVFRNPG